MHPKELPRTITAFSGALMCIGVNLGAGIFIVPGLMLQLVGSAGMVIVLMVIGAIASFLGCWAYVELGLMNPVSGGDKEYLELAFPRPKAFMSFLLCQVRCWMINPGSSAAVIVASAEFMMEGVYGHRSVTTNQFVAEHYDYVARGYATIFMLLIISMHVFIPQTAIKIQNSMVIVKTGLLFLGVAAGIVALSGGLAFKPANNLENLFGGTILDLNPLASAFLKVIFVYDGWNTLNYALSEVIEPEKNFPISSFTAITTISFLFIGFPIMMFAVVPKVDILNPDNALLASQFFTLTLGSLLGSRILPFFIAISAFSMTMCNTFSGSRLAFESARDGFLPYSAVLSKISRFNSPANALMFKGFLTIFYVIVPPPGKVYDFLIDLVSYPLAIFYALVVTGCLYLRISRPEIRRPLKSTWVGNIIYITIMVIVTIIPFIPPTDQSGIPYWLSSSLGLASIVLFAGYYYRKVVVLKCMETSFNALKLESDLASDDIEASFGEKWKK
jgi:amino acid transporter